MLQQQLVGLDKLKKLHVHKLKNKELLIEQIYKVNGAFYYKGQQMKAR
jgi:hypothetical protein